MNVALNLNRKRSRLALESDDDDDEQQHQQNRRPELSPSLSTFSDTSLKRTKTESELDALDVIAPEDAWSVDTGSILTSHTLPSAPGSGMEPHNNVAKYAPDSSIIVLCVQGNLELHYDLLCSILPDLYLLSPSLQALVLCRDPSRHTPSTSTSFSLPLIQAFGPNYNHFGRLGLLVLPFGWGAGRHANTAAGRTVQNRLMDLLKSCVQLLAQE
ncbi:hypothetical protein BDV95DRAFT_625999 [Massariosphaeria phaeospora]|uniref:Uncharacterized protein n=1 Tax=Massariosphaeria phaeospora TaxID=100035 RepID=A0A7C8MF29_9PLEO|nr:hypothetical protein BDV95DRAFT_625999 [Massariosphaeria phaeospora]